MSSGSAESDRSVTTFSTPITESGLASAPGRQAGRPAPRSVLDGDARLMETILEATARRVPAAESRLQRFLREPVPARAILVWLGACPGATREEIVQRLNRDVAYVDRLLSEQINAILHHHAFQRLEAAWRGLEYLVHCIDAEQDEGVKIKVFDISKRQLFKDLDNASEFDQSQTFRKIYENEFGMPGGEPYGALIGDFEFTNHPDDIDMLGKISRIAAAAFCPFIASASPTLFGLDDFHPLEHRLSHAKTFQQIDYLKWRSLRDSEDARFVGLTLPHVLMRLPYADDGSRVDRFLFREDVSGPDHSKYLWGSAAYAFGGVLIRAFAQAGWLADIRGVRRGVEGGGLVTGLPVHSFSTDRAGLAPKCSTDVIVTDELEKVLSDLGFIPLCHCKDTEYSAFYANQSVQKPKKYDRLPATLNAKISARLQYMLCVSRFAHYIKVLGRDKVGAFSEPTLLEQFLQDWIVKYVTRDPEAPPEVKAKYPLRDAQVQVRPEPGKPGAFRCILHLSPHYELDELTASVRLITELAPARTA